MLIWFLGAQLSTEITVSKGEFGSTWVQTVGLNLETRVGCMRQASDRTGCCVHWWSSSHREQGLRAVSLLAYPKPMSSLNSHFLLTVMHNLPMISTLKAAYLMKSISMHI